MKVEYGHFHGQKGLVGSMNLVLHSGSYTVVLSEDYYDTTGLVKRRFLLIPCMNTDI